MELIWNIVTYVLPTGAAVQLLNWLRTRKLAKARQAGDIDAAYLDNINLLRQELIKIQDENRKLYRAIARLDRTVAKATGCSHWGDCPVRSELQKSKPDNNPQPPHKRHTAKPPSIRPDPDASAPQPGADKALAEPTLSPSPRGRL